MIPIIGHFNSVEVSASNDKKYKVAWVNDSFAFEIKDSSDDYDEAIEMMNNLSTGKGDYAILCDESLSPMKVVAMDAGLVFSYPYRSGTNTQKIYSAIKDDYNPDLNKAYTYVDAHREMTYHKTSAHFESTSKFPYEHGWVKVTLNGFEGYTDLEYCDLIPMKMIENEVEVTLGGNAKGIYNYPQVAFNVVPQQHYYYVENDGKYNNLHLVFYSNWNANGNKPEKGDTSYGVAPSFMQANTHYYSDDGINFYSDRLLKNFVGTYYNYYQFVPFRTYSKISPTTINNYITIGANTNSVMLNTGADFISNQELYGVNGALVAAMGIHESGWGNSNISGDKYNLFGWGAYDSDTSKAVAYNSVSECIAQQMGDNLSNYLDQGSPYYYSQSLGNKGGGFMTMYASDPYWAEQIAHYYYGIDKLSKNNNGELTDYNSYVLALVKTPSSIKRLADASSETLYSTINGRGYQKNLIVNILDNINGFGKTQLSNPMNDNGSICYPYSLPKGTKVLYDANRSIGYIDLNNLEFINEKVNRVINEDKLKLTSIVNQIKFDNDSLYINGIGVIEGMEFSSKVGVKHQLIVNNLTDSTKNFIIDLDTVDAGSFNLNDGIDYKYCKYEKNIPLSVFDEGSYTFLIKVINGSNSYETNLRCVNQDSISIQKEFNDLNYHIVCNQVYSYRVELDVCSTSIDYSLINKPSYRPSLYSLKSSKINLNEENGLSIGGIGFIYYVDYEEINNPIYKIYLVNSKTNNYEYDAITVDYSDMNYAALLNLKRKLNLIGFETNIDVKGYETGKYYFLLRNDVKDGDKIYTEISYLTNPDKQKLPDPIIISNKKYSLINDAVKDRLVLVVEEVDE